MGNTEQNGESSESKDNDANDDFIYANNAKFDKLLKKEIDDDDIPLIQDMEFYGSDKSKQSFDEKENDLKNDTEVCLFDLFYLYIFLFFTI